ncbi:MAG: hypothetical protein ACYDBB_00490 [Armatimonadota bacterium]
MRMFSFVLLALILGICTVSTLAQAGAAPGQNTTPPTPPKNDRKDHPQPVVVTLEGTVKGTTVPKNVDDPGAIVIFTLVNDAGSTKVRLAPPKYLAKIDLKLVDDTKVSVVGWQLPRKDAPVEARELTIDGNKYEFRTVKNTKLWDDFLILPQVVMEGTIKDLINPAPGAPQPDPNQRPKGQKPVSFTLVTDKGDIAVEVGMAKLLAQIGLALNNDLKVAVAGWQRTSGGEKRRENGVVITTPVRIHLTVRTITIDGKEYALRKEDGKPAGAHEGQKKNNHTPDATTQPAR